MSTLSASPPTSTVPLDNLPLQQSFTTHILPRVETHARVYFRKHRDRDEMAAEAVALAWKWFVRLAERAKDATRWSAAFATYAVRAVLSGRHVTGRLSGRDVLSPVCQQRQGFYVSKLPDFSTKSTNPFSEALTDNTVTPPDDQAAFRIDFSAWLRTHSRRDRAIIHDAARGERTKELAARYRLTPSRISHLRSAWSDEWQLCQA